MTTSADRCRNCGLMHRTQNCPSYGPMFPAPGKNKTDYIKEHQKIQDLLAGDILREHYGHDHDDDQVPSRGHGPATKEPELTYQSVTCGVCGADPGDPCHSKGGLKCKSHKARIDAAKHRAGLLA